LVEEFLSRGTFSSGIDKTEEVGRQVKYASKPRHILSSHSFVGQMGIPDKGISFPSTLSQVQSERDKVPFSRGIATDTSAALQAPPVESGNTVLQSTAFQNDLNFNAGMYMDGQEETSGQPFYSFLEFPLLDFDIEPSLHAA
jgi:hypothetical protein